MDNQAFELLLARFDSVDRQLEAGTERMDKMQERLDELWGIRRVVLFVVTVAGTIGGALFSFFLNLFARGSP